MRFRCLIAGLAALAAIPALAPAHAATPPKHVAKPRATQTAPAGNLFASGGLADWYRLDNASATDPMPQGPPKKLDTTARTDEDGFEHITVYGRRLDRNRAWREDLRDRTPSYEAGGSDAAQAMAGISGAAPPMPAWTSPDQMHTMSSLKDALGLCGPPLTCPGL